MKCQRPEYVLCLCWCLYVYMALYCGCCRPTKSSYRWHFEGGSSKWRHRFAGEHISQPFTHSVSLSYLAECFHSPSLCLSYQLTLTMYRRVYASHHTRSLDSIPFYYSLQCCFVFLRFLSISFFLFVNL